MGNRMDRFALVEGVLSSAHSTHSLLLQFGLVFLRQIDDEMAQEIAGFGQDPDIAVIDQGHHPPPSVGRPTARCRDHAGNSWKGFTGNEAIKYQAVAPMCNEA